MKTDNSATSEPVCEDALAAIGDLAGTGSILQEVLASGTVSARVAQASGLLFTEIARLSGAVDPASAENDA